MRAQREDVGPDAYREILGHLERVLPEGAGAHDWRAGQEEAPVGPHSDDRIGRRGLAAVPQRKMTRDELARPAAAHEAGPDEPGRVGGCRVSFTLRGQSVRPVGAINEPPPIAVGVVVRQLEMTVRAQLHRDLAEHVAGGYVAVGRAERPRTGGVWVSAGVREA